MYRRKTSRRYKDKTSTNTVLVESVRTSKGPRQKTICTLGGLAPQPRHEWLKLARRIEPALSDQPGLFDEPADRQVEAILAKVRARQAGARAERGELIAVEADKVTTERHRERSMSAWPSGAASASRGSSKSSVSTRRPGGSPAPCPELLGPSTA